MTRVSAGELDALAVLFERHHRPLYGFFYRLTRSAQVSEDLVQEVFLRILKYRHTWAANSGFTTWLYQVARNTHVDWLRKKRPEPALDEAPEVASGAIGADAALEDEQQARLVREALKRLPADKRELLIMARFQGLKYDQIASILACEVNTVKVRVHRAMRDLAAAFRALEKEGLSS
jgi:RNA polymerase sigma factor (sigma-70 family)